MNRVLLMGAVGTGIAVDCAARLAASAKGSGIRFHIDEDVPVGDLGRYRSLDELTATNTTATNAEASTTVRVRTSLTSGAWDELRTTLSHGWSVVILTGGGVTEEMLIDLAAPWVCGAHVLKDDVQADGLLSHVQRCGGCGGDQRPSRRLLSVRKHRVKAGRHPE